MESKRDKLNKNFKKLIKTLTNNSLPYIIKISLIFFVELFFNFIRKPPSHTDSKNIKNKTILITGGTGGICKKLIKELQRHNKLFVITRQHIPTSNNENIKYIQSDLENIQIEEILEQIKTEKIDILICAAGVLDTTNLHRNFLINFVAHQNLIEKIDVKKVLLVSSCVSLCANIKPKLDYKRDTSGEFFYGKSYAESKYLLFSLADTLYNNNRDVVLVHPGIVNTGLFNNKNNFIEKILRIFIKYFGISQERAADNIMKGLLYLNSNRTTSIVFWYMDLKLNFVYQDYRWRIL